MTASFPAAWREGRHLQADTRRLSVWIGLAADRWMIGVVYNHDSKALGFGLGPIYFGIGT